jgi:RNase P subunit RPR2
MQPQMLMCPECRKLMGPQGKVSVTYQPDRHAFDVKLTCPHCNKAVFLGVPLDSNFVVRSSTPGPR